MRIERGKGDCEDFVSATCCGGSMPVHTVLAWMGRDSVSEGRKQV